MSLGSTSEIILCIDGSGRISFPVKFKYIFERFKFSFDSLGLVR